MIKSIKNLFMLATFLIILMTGCQSDTPEVALPEISTFLPVETIAEIPFEKYSLNIVWHSDRNETSIDLWKELFNDTFSIEFINYQNYALYSKEGSIINDPPNFIYPGDNSEAIASKLKSTDGLYLISVSDYEKLFNKRNELFIPFSDLQVTSLINSDLKDGLYDSNGQLWCIPREISEPILWCRVYEPDYTKNSDFIQPATLSELENLLISKKFENPDLCPILIDSETLIGHSLFDIFSAFNIDYKLPPIYYDETLEIYTDPLVSENMKDCINFIVQLADSELIEFDLSSDGSTDIPVYSKVTTYSAEPYYSVNLKNDLFEYPTHQFVKPYSYLYFIGIGTKDTESIEKFIEYIYTDKQGYLAGRYGSSDTFTSEDNLIYIDESIVRPNLVGSLPYVDSLPVSSSTDIEKLNTIYALRTELNNTDYFKYIPFIASSANTSIEQEILSRKFKELFANYIKTPQRSSIDELFAEYIRFAKVHNNAERINYFNEKNNTGFEFSY